MPKNPPFDPNQFYWANIPTIKAKRFICGFCGDRVAASTGIPLTTKASNQVFQAGIYICPYCQGPTFIYDGEQVPAPSIGDSVPNVPPDLNALYEEARRCTTTSCYTAAVLLCRKMLMNIAVKEGAKEGLHFIQYVEYLEQHHYIPPNGKHWVNHIREKGNEATHEIKQMDEQEATDLLNFVEMLLRLIYDFPARIPKPAPVVLPKT